MDNAEQSPRPPSKGIFDTASLLGIPSPQTLCKSGILPNLVGVSPKKLSKGKSEKDSNHAKISEKSKTTSNNLPSPVSGISSVSGNQMIKSSSKKPKESVSDAIARLLPTGENPPSKRKSSKPKSCKPDVSKNGKSLKAEKKRSKQPKEKKTKKSSSESDGHIDSSCSSSGPDSSGAVSSSSSDTSDDEEREKQAKQLARLKKQQQELQRKVQELTHHKPEVHMKKTSSSSKNSMPPSGPVNHSIKPVPSPAHSSPLIPVPPKSISPEVKPNPCDPLVEEEQNVAFPLDLCMKKQEPTFEVTAALASSYMPISMTTTKTHKPLKTTGSNSSNIIGANCNKSMAPKKRGRKPKAAQIPMNPVPAHSEKNSIKDISTLLMPTKMDMMPTHVLNSSLLKPGNSSLCPKVHAPNTLGNPSDMLPLRKNFTLDSLLNETNGGLDILHYPETDHAMFHGSAMPNKNMKIKDRLKNTSNNYSSNINNSNNSSNKMRKFEDKIKESESPSNLETSSPSETDPDDDSDSEDTEHSGSLVDGQKRKHSYDEDSEDFRNKKRRMLPDEREVQIPLEHGWRRETRIRCFSRSGVRGEVSYYAPCGKKLRSYPEVVRYLIKNGITDISRDNFTFSTKVNVGEFLESASSGSGQDYVLLSEQEVAARIEEVRARKGRLGVQNRKSSHHKSTDEEEQQRQWEQKQIQHHLEQQARAREALELKLLRQAQRDQALVAAREEKRLRAEESRKQKEQQRLMKQQEKFERIEQLRIEREIRAQQILEEQEIKRQQAVFLREQERERRRQHMILVRALENRKKQEERERKREEILFEKRINREKKMEQRRIELDYLRELKKPVDDMMLKDLMPLPSLKRIPGVKLAGKAFADILMVFEFLHNFGETLGFDVDSLPALNTLQSALLNLDEKCEEELLSVVHHLLVCAIDDPGVLHSSESATVLGQNLKDADITNNNVSEVLRLYFIAQDKRLPMLEWLQLKPFLSLNASQKAEILAYMCDELLTSRLLTRQIDSNIENVNVLRKDKWLVEGELRRYRSIQQRRALKARLSAMEENRDNPNCANMLSADIPDFSLTTPKENQLNADDSDIKEKSVKEKLEDMENELANESGNESDDTQAPAQMSDGEEDDLHLSNEEINKKIEKLSKQLTACSNKLTKAFYTIRGATFGMDRYHRRYWVLPKSGGVFIESMESSLKPEEREKVLSSAKAAPKEEKEKEITEEPKDDKVTEVKKELTEKENSPEKEKKEKERKLDTPVIEKSKVSESKDVKPVIKEEVKPSEKVKDIVEDKEEVAEANKVNLKEEEIKCPVKKEEDMDVEIKIPEKINAEEVVENKSIKEPSVSKESSEEENKNTIKSSSTVIESKLDVKPDIKEASTKDSSLNLKDNESKIFSPAKCEKDQKSILPMEIISPKKSTPLDIKFRSDCDPFPNLKKEHKSKKDDKREGKHRESENKYIDKMMDIKDEKKPNVNIFMPNLCDTSINLDLGTPKLHNSTDRGHTPNPSIPPEQSWLLHSPLFASILAGNMLFNGPLMSQRDMNGTYFNLPKNDSNNPFGPFLGLQSGMLSEQLFKSLSDKPTNQKPWFSILPRMPCDESLISSPQTARNSGVHSPANICSPDMRNVSRSSHPSPSPNPPGHAANALSNLQMELMNGVVPPGFFLHPFLPPQFGPTFQATPSTTCSSHHSSFTSTMSHSSPMPDFNLNFNRPPQTSTPNSIPTPSATPGPASQGCATPTSRDTPSPCFAKRLMMEKQAQEYEHPQPISVELQKGWWRITEPHQLKLVISALHHRGIREKMFQKQLQKHFTFACTSCSQGQDTELEITDQDKEIEKMVGGAPEQEPQDFWYRDIALRVDMGILEQVENLEERVDGSSMQIKFWKPPGKLSTDPLSKFIPACEQYTSLTSDEIFNAIKERQMRKGSKKSSSRKKKPPVKKEQEPEPMEVDPDKKAEDDAAEPSTSELDTSEVIEQTVEEPEKPIPEEVIRTESEFIPLPPGKLNPVEEAKRRLLKVETAIERRYLRPPLGISANELNRSTLSGSSTTNNTSSADGPDEELIPTGLLKWRNAVEMSKTAAQLAMCVNFLENFTAWDKSIMRASCQFCHSGDNEEKLLLCDGCDKGYHTYCFKPVMETIPEGDWYCFECLNKATGDNVCVICGTKGKLIKCETCPKTFHLNCLEPPLAKMPKGKWYCSGCSLTRPKKSKKSNANKEKESKEAKEPKETTTTEKPEKPKKEEKEKTPKAKSSEKKKKEKTPPPPPGNKDLAPCSAILDGMQKHEDAWPFLTPVNTKQFPTYKKVIKKPMDIATMRNRLDSGQYKSREEFAMDARLIFDNCETFNEDDSPVGQAGHSMRAFFETKWLELSST